MTVDPLLPIAPGEPELDETALRPAAPLGPEIRRICLVHLQAALDGLLRTDDRDAGVHEARKALKAARATIRLVRDPLGQWIYRQENVVLRDIARVIAPVRDGAVLVETLDDLVGRYGTVIEEGVWQPLRVALVDRHEWHRRRVLGDDDLFAALVTTLRCARNRMAAWPADEDSGDNRALADDWRSIGDGVRRVYRRGREGMALASDTGSAHDFHEWRKRVKYLRHQIEILQPLWPEVLGSTAAELDRLGELLGVQHDLFVLTDTIEADRALCPDPASRHLLAALAGHERGRLESTALERGAYLYVEAPGSFIDRLGGYWVAARRPERI